jgi:hypothetical protein
MKSLTLVLACVVTGRPTVRLRHSRISSRISVGVFVLFNDLYTYCRVEIMLCTHPFSLHCISALFHTSFHSCRWLRCQYSWSLIFHELNVLSTSS